MAYNFMDDVGLWGVVRRACMPQVLGAAKDPEGEAVQELALAENAVGWLDDKPSFILQVGG